MHGLFLRRVHLPVGVGTGAHGPGSAAKEGMHAMGITGRRLDLVLDALERDGRVTVKDLATRLAISTETVRRDLRDLELRGHARRVYGGAVLDRRESDRPFDERVRVAAREKARIAEAALPLVEDGMTVFIDAGTTTLAFARKLLGRRIRVHTNSIDIAALLAGDPQAQVTVLGGDMKPDYRALFGHRTHAVLREHIYDVAIMGIVTVHHAHGFMDLGEDEAVLRRFAVERTRHSVILADSSKFGRLGTIRTFGLDAVDTLVTNAPLTRDIARAFQRTRVDVIHA
ncbi:DeoR/GlpR family DNA-binding transcription regulator [Methylobacterium sp. WCS2018Hpa-22]|uniref:DeoR/GlpR family DNA-binding transcription regulator n=1 Tax=Methylobacterium sp. WCS2018Hpa-22 TaxID=3073633 RepID=UPI00288B8DBF|nr:DeoR/GlpR family DNA-binding transcription regulator [Methylobacterium sp. WCS2018Hpa-22]